VSETGPGRWGVHQLAGVRKRPAYVQGRGPPNFLVKGGGEGTSGETITRLTKKKLFTKFGSWLRENYAMPQTEKEDWVCNPRSGEDLSDGSWEEGDTEAHGG